MYFTEQSNYPIVYHLWDYTPYFQDFSTRPDIVKLSYHRTCQLLKEEKYDQVFAESYNILKSIFLDSISVLKQVICKIISIS